MSIINSVMYVKLASAELCEKVVQDTGGSLKFNHRDGNIGNVTVDHVGFGVAIRGSS